MFAPLRGPPWPPRRREEPDRDDELLETLRRAIEIGRGPRLVPTRVPAGATDGDDVRAVAPACAGTTVAMWVHAQRRGVRFGGQNGYDHPGTGTRGTVRRVPSAVDSALDFVVSCREHESGPLENRRPRISRATVPEDDDADPVLPAGRHGTRPNPIGKPRSARREVHRAARCSDDQTTGGSRESTLPSVVGRCRFVVFSARGAMIRGHDDDSSRDRRLVRDPAVLPARCSSGSAWQILDANPIRTNRIPIHEVECEAEGSRPRDRPGNRVDGVDPLLCPASPTPGRTFHSTQGFPARESGTSRTQLDRARRRRAGPGSGCGILRLESEPDRRAAGCQASECTATSYSHGHTTARNRDSTFPSAVCRRRFPVLPLIVPYPGIGQPPRGEGRR
jgi:hypothetical protein